MAIKPRGKGIPRVTAYSALVTFANFIVASLTGNGAFVLPLPALASITTAANNLAGSIALWGVVGARGSHADLMNMRRDAFILRNLLVQELGYVQSVVSGLGVDYATATAILISSGFGAKSGGTPQGLLGQPQNVHQFFKNSISIYHVGLRWKKPIGITSPGNVHNYQIWRSLVNNFNDVSTSVIATSTKGAFIDTTPPTPAGTPVYYFITASNDAGIGAPSASLSVITV